MCMDVMECFLHALRLHWYFFMSNFIGWNFRINFTKPMDTYLIHSLLRTQSKNITMKMNSEQLYIRI